MKNIVLFSLLLFFFHQEAYSQNWMDKLIPVKTTIREIEKILISEPYKAKILEEPKHVNWRIFHFADGALTVYFSLGRYVFGAYGKFELEKDIIIQAAFSPSKKKRISYYEKDVKSLKKEFDGTMWHYENVKKGISYTMQFERVYEISFSGPENVDLVHCKE